MTLCLMECVFFSFASLHVNNISYQGPIKSVRGFTLGCIPAASGCMELQPGVNPFTSLVGPG